MIRHLTARTEALLRASPLAAHRDELRRLRRACGCRAGALTLLLFAPPGLWMLARYASAHPRLLGPGTLAAAALAIVLGSMAVGKAGGLVVARFRLARRVAELELPAASRR
jgi:hypothetical protein